jgi:hypothetical protein
VGCHGWGTSHLFLNNNKIYHLITNDGDLNISTMAKVNTMNWDYVIDVGPSDWVSRGFGISDGKVYLLYRSTVGEEFDFVEVLMNDPDLGTPGKAVKLQRVGYLEETGECFMIDENNDLWYLSNVRKEENNNYAKFEYCKINIDGNIKFIGFLNQNNLLAPFESDNVLAITENGDIYSISAEHDGGDSTPWSYTEPVCTDNDNDKILNAYFLDRDYSSGFGAEDHFCCTFCFKESGLYFIYNGDGGVDYENNQIVKIQDCPDFITTNFIGSTWFNVFVDEGAEELTHYPSYNEIALFIDKSGKLYKALVRYTNDGSEIIINHENPIYFEQVGTDSDWNYVPCTIEKNGKYIAQKGGKIVQLNVSDFNITYTECIQPEESIGTLISDMYVRNVTEHVTQNLLIFKNGNFDYNIAKI